MKFYERSDSGVWFIRNELGQIVSPNFALFEQLLDWLSTKEFGVDVERQLADA